MEILGNIAEAVLQKLGSLALEEIELSLSFKDDLEKLRSYLSRISKILLDDAERQQEQSHAVRDGLRKLKAALNDAQDLLDDLSAQALSQKVEAQYFIITQVHNFFFCSEMDRRIRGIIERLEGIDKEGNMFDFKGQQVNDLILARRERRQSFMRIRRENYEEANKKVIGREKDKEAIIAMLYGDNNESLSVIPIVGMGGLGKTTLAQLVFNDDWVKGYFDLLIWLWVSDDLKAEDTVRKIITVTCSDSGLHTNPLHILDGKKFLLVLDDVWKGSPVEWDTLRTLLKSDVRGSKILVTTRNRDTASIVGRNRLYPLAGLPPDACWSLFERWAFWEEESIRHPNLTKIGREVVEKCGGIPLAIRTVGSLLCLKRNETYWLSVKNDESWDKARGEDDILPVLKLSYDQLPSHLKECFAYCSMLPKGEEFDKETLIQLWMAQGLIHLNSSDEQLEDVGGWYFNELVSRSLFDVVRENHKAEIVKGRMHDLLHDLAKLVAGSERFSVNCHTKNMFESTRHVSFRGHYLKEEIFSTLKASKLRTLFLPIKLGPSSESFLNALFSGATYLRVLDLSNSGIKYLPNCLGYLKHLRYLDLNGNHDLKYLPDSICRLHFLQTLKLLGCVQISTFPRKFSNLVSLRNLIINSPKMRTWEKQLGSLTSLKSLSIFHCDNLVSLSEGIQHLSALRTLRIHNCAKLTSLPMRMENCTALEYLEIVNCTKINSFEECLLGLPNLRSLTIKGLPKLVFLPDRPECYKNTLQYLYISDCISLMRFPECLGNLSSLLRMYIIGCPNLLNLPHKFSCLVDLQVLHIDQCPLLSSRCQRDVGNDWPKIAHVPEIYVDKKRI